MVTNINEKMIDVERKLDTLLSVSPKAVINSLQIQLVQDGDKLSQITKGASATFTYIKDSKNEFWAIGSAHCSFYYSGNFVMIPKELCKYVDCIYIYPQLLNSNMCFFRKYDAVAIKLKDFNPADYHSNFIWDLAVPSLTNGHFNVEGLSNAAYVLGDHLIYDDKEGVYYFVEESGEPDNSGTLIFALTQPPTLIGVYQGTLGNVAGMKRRGVVVPLNIVKMKKYPPTKVNNIPDRVKLGVPCNGHINPKEFKITQIDNSIMCSYTDEHKKNCITVL